MWFLNMDKYKSQAIEVFLFNFVYKQNFKIDKNINIYSLVINLIIKQYYF